jgi:hypothetical protein
MDHRPHPSPGQAGGPSTSADSTSKYIAIPDAIARRKDIRPSGKIVYGATYSLSSWGRGQCTASIGTLVKLTGLSRSTVARDIGKLADLKLIIVDGYDARKRQSGCIRIVVDALSQTDTKQCVKPKQCIDSDRVNALSQTDPPIQLSERTLNTTPPKPPGGNGGGISIQEEKTEPKPNGIPPEMTPIVVVNKILAGSPKASEIERNWPKILRSVKGRADCIEAAIREAKKSGLGVINCIVAWTISKAREFAKDGVPEHYQAASVLDHHPDDWCTQYAKRVTCAPHSEFDKEVCWRIWDQRNDGKNYEAAKTALHAQVDAEVAHGHPPERVAAMRRYIDAACDRHLCYLVQPELESHIVDLQKKGWEHDAIRAHILDGMANSENWYGLSDKAIGDRREHAKMEFDRLISGARADLVAKPSPDRYIDQDGKIRKWFRSALTQRLPQLRKQASTDERISVFVAEQSPHANTRARELIEAFVRKLLASTEPVAVNSSPTANDSPMISAETTPTDESRFDERPMIAGTIHVALAS